MDSPPNTNDAILLRFYRYTANITDQIVILRYYLNRSIHSRIITPDARSKVWIFEFNRYARIAKNKHTEVSAKKFEPQQVQRLSNVMAKNYDHAKYALSNLDSKRAVPVVSKFGTEYSGFHSGAGETTITDLLARIDQPKYGLILIDEIESSLHPRAQRRLMRLLAQVCREKDLQIIITTHSPYILDELPQKARICIMEVNGSKEIISGVSSQFAMTKMDDEPHPECDLYVEDEAAKIMLAEIMSAQGKELFSRCSIIPFGAASVGYALGQMVKNDRFTRPSIVFLDGDNEAKDGCILLPGGDAPEQVIFKALQKKNWDQLWARIGRDIGEVQGVCEKAMTLPDHHQWVNFSAKQLGLSISGLWHGMCAEWVKGCLPEEDAKRLVDHIRTILP